jgi:hypothetical protein
VQRLITATDLDVDLGGTNYKVDAADRGAGVFGLDGLHLTGRKFSA